MSRGYGITMSSVLDRITGEWTPIEDLAAVAMCTKTPTRADVESVRRACKRLAEHGEVELDYVFVDRYKYGEGIRDGEMWSDIIRENGYEPDARPSHPFWKLAARRGGAS